MYKCKQCDFASATSRDLRNHKKTHTGEKSHKFSQCSFAFIQFEDAYVTSGDLRNHKKTHLKTHSGGKQYKCKQCDFACVTSSDLRNHMKTHSGENRINVANATLNLFIQAV